MVVVAIHLFCRPCQIRIRIVPVADRPCPVRGLVDWIFVCQLCPTTMDTYFIINTCLKFRKWYKTVYLTTAYLSAQTA